MGFSGRAVEDFDFGKDLSVNDLVSQMGASGGFTAKKLAVAVDILDELVKDKDIFRILSFPACIISTGTRGVIKELVKRKLFDAVITTTGTLDHDIARCIKDYYHGDFNLDDNLLVDQGVNRLGNILIPNECYGEALEAYMQPVLKGFHDSGVRDIAGHSLIKEFGKNIGNKDSIIYWCAKNDIPVFVPGFYDGAFGSQVYFFQSNNRDFRIDLFADEDLLSQKMFGAKKSGALMVGGGISKHHVIWWSQFADGLDKAVYFTSAPEWDGSLSGARVREAVSWGKVKKKARYVTVEGDATINLPLACASLFEKL